MARWLILLQSIIFWSSFVSADLDDGLEAYYSFRGNAYDNSGNGHNGTLRPDEVNGPALIEDILGNAESAYFFDGVDDYIDLTASVGGSQLDPGNTFSVALWVNPQSIADLQSFVAWNSTQGDDLFVLGFYDGGMSVWIRGESFSMGEKFTGWHHLTVIVEETGMGTASNVKVFKNGSMEWEEELAAVPGSGSSNETWSLGQEWDASGPSDFFEGDMDEVRIYSGVLTPEEVAQLAGTHTIVASLDPPDHPNSPASAMVSIEELYDYLDTGIAGMKRPGEFREPTAPPGNSGRSLDEVHEIVILHCVTCEGTLFGTRWCDNGDGTVTDLTSGLVWLKNAAWGSTHAFWVDTAYGVNAHDRAAQLWDGSLLEESANLDDGSTEGDWRLPTRQDVYDLTHGIDPIADATPHAFTGILPDLYWSSTSDEYDRHTAWHVNLLDGTLDHSAKSNTFSVWPVRDRHTPVIMVIPRYLAVDEAGGTDVFSVVLSLQPSENVVLDIISNDIGEAVVDTASLTFSPSDWNVAQEVMVTAVDDIGWRNDATTITISVNDALSDDDFDSAQDQTVRVVCLDDDLAPGITATPSSVTVAENGGMEVFSVVLDTRPDSDVVLNVASADEDEAAVDVSSLTFDTGTWSIPQDVTVTGVDDLIDRDDSTSISLSVDDALSDDTYDSVPDEIVPVACVDDDVAGKTVVPMAITVDENGGTETFTVVLDSQPQSDVVTNVTSMDPAEAVVAPSALTFNSATWVLPQTVTVTGVNDEVFRDDSTTIVVRIDDANSSDEYDPVPDSIVAVTCRDDEGPNIRVNPSSVTVAEAGGTDVFAVSLTTRPFADVITQVSSQSTAEATVDRSSLTFTLSNWNIPQPIQVTGIDDDIDRNDSTTIDVAAVSGDPDYVGLSRDLPVACTDDDAAGLMVNPTTIAVAENGGTDTFSVTLTSQPTSNVVTDLSVVDPAEAFVTPSSLTFTPGDWFSAQDVTVTGIDDSFDRDDSTGVTISVNDALSDDTYDSVADGTVAVTCIDDEEPGLVVNPTSVTVAEAGGGAAFNVTLTTQPALDVVTDVNSGNVNEATVDRSRLTFTSSTWNQAQIVNVTGVDDDYDRDDSTSVTVSVNDAMSDDAFDPVPDENVFVTCIDDETADLIVSPLAVTVAEAGGTDIFTVTLGSRPTSEVVTDVTSTDTGEATIDRSILTFTSGSWDVNQTVTVTGVDDEFDRDDSTNVIISVNDALSDDAYDPLPDENVFVTCIDDDTADLIVSPLAVTVAENGGTDIFTVILGSRPESNVVTDVFGADTGEATVDRGVLTFSPGNWDSTQTVTVTGVNDASVGSDSTTVTISINDGLSDDTYDPVLDKEVSVTCIDDDL